MGPQLLIRMCWLIIPMAPALRGGKKEQNGTPLLGNSTFLQETWGGNPIILEPATVQLTELYYNN